MGNKDARTWAKTSISSRNSGHGATVRFSRILSTEFRSRIPRGFQGMEQGYMHSGQNIAKIFTCVRYLTGLEKLPGAVLWNVGRRSNEEPLCPFIGNSMVWFVDY